MTTNLDTATYLARAIFTCGPNYVDRVQRMQFMGGRKPDEFDMGGLNEEALRNTIFRALERLQK